MKKVFLFLIIVILLNSFAQGFGVGPASETGGIETVEPEERTPFGIFGERRGVIDNKAPETTLNYPTDSIVVNNHLVELSWSYFDIEGDKQVNYQLEVDNDPRFLSPITYYGYSETKRKISLFQGDIDYYWRAKSRDNIGWGKFSDVGSFYLDSSSKVCEDGTPYSQCSKISFKYCDYGELRDECQVCGCPLNSDCTLSGVCRFRTCYDNTLYGSCSFRKPNFCQNGELKEVCSLCGCDNGRECKADGSCSLKKDTVIISGELIKKERFAERFLNFLKNLF